ncbi:MAG: FAD-dependent oxidoreductase [Devosia sp.]|nr:FAD-dependent oxidoreductase [Devosia sp.]
MENHDLVVIGSGPAGRRAAIQAAKIGKSVVVVENRLRVGGVSVRTGTIPSKTPALKCCSTPPAASAPLPISDSKPAASRRTAAAASRSIRSPTRPPCRTSTRPATAAGRPHHRRGRHRTHPYRPGGPQPWRHGRLFRRERLQ